MTGVRDFVDDPAKLGGIAGPIMTEKAEERRRRWIQFGVLPVLFYAGAKLSLAFAVTPGVLVMLWIPNSIVLATLLHFHGRRYGLFAAAIIVAEIAADYPTFSLTEAVCYGAINVLEATVAYLLLRRWRFDPRFPAPADLAKFVMAGPVLAALVSACAAGLLQRVLHGSQAGLVEFMRVFWFSDGLGLLLLTPCVLNVWPPLEGSSEEPRGLRWYDGIALVIGLAILVGIAQSQQRMFHGMILRPFLVIPVVLYVAARLTVRVTAIVTVLVAALVLYVTHNGQQPFGDVSIRETIVSMQELLFVMSTMSLGVATLLSQHRATTKDLEARVRERTAEITAANLQLAQLAVTDPLTGVLNRRALVDVLCREIERARRYGQPLAVIVFDIDHFKEVNDRYGHSAGDEVLQRVTAVATSVIRHADAMARYGGEEFVIVAPETGEKAAMQLAERVRCEVRSTEIVVRSHALRVTASFGVAAFQPDDQGPDEVLRRADHALYAAKASGRDRVVKDLAEASV